MFFQKRFPGHVEYSFAYPMKNFTSSFRYYASKTPKTKIHWKIYFIFGKKNMLMLIITLPYGHVEYGFGNPFEIFILRFEVSSVKIPKEVMGKYFLGKWETWAMTFHSTNIIQCT